MSTEIGLIPVLSNFQTVNRPLPVFVAHRVINECNESIFFIVRQKDADKLKQFGYSILKTILKTGNTPMLIDYGKGSGLQLEQKLLF